MPNRLSAASSPYLLQHADNPVDWHEWGDEAFSLARETDRPILLSVGYAACHWCHVMAHESFEDEPTAALMNDLFVNVKVDREERPDVDRIYMDAVQALTGQGGWPMTVFLDPAGRPFFAGTYFPPDDRPGHPSFRRVMSAVSDAWTNRRDEVETQAARLTEAVTRSLPPADEPPGAEAVTRGYQSLRAAYDPGHGGFGGAPKFPQAPALELLARLAGDPGSPEARSMLEGSLAAMARGGIHDHLAGGFARYTVDAHWLVPHFEKMLYDNALLARLYLRGWQITGVDDFRRVAVDTLGYLLADLGLPEGGFASSEDADSEGEEGKFYVWSREEFHEAAGPDDGPVAADWFGVTPGGNFEGSNILWRAAPAAEVAARHGMTAAEASVAVERARARLLERRAKRVRPGLDDKVVTAWNGLALRALAEAGAVLAEPRFVAAARRNAEFVLGEVRRGDGRLLRSWRRGVGTVPAFCDDYGAYAVGLFALFQATGELRWFTAAERLVREMIDLFADSEGGFYTTGHDAPKLIDRPKDVFDNPTPSANSLAAEALLHLRHYTGDASLDTYLDGALRLAGAVAARHPQAVGHALAVAATRVAGTQELAIVGEPGAGRLALERAGWEHFRPGTFLAVNDGTEAAAADVLPLLAGRVPHEGPPLAYVCRDFVCAAPTGDPDTLAVLLAEAGLG